MADHALVDWTLDTLAANYNPDNVATSTPVLVDDDDGTTYELDTSTGTRSELQRGFEPDAAQTNIVTVDPNPDRQESVGGTYLYIDVTDAVGITIEAAHQGVGGEVTDPAEFSDLWKEVRRALLEDRLSFPSVGGVDYHTVVPRSPGRPPEDGQSNYFALSFDLEFQGDEQLE